MTTDSGKLQMVVQLRDMAGLGLQPLLANPAAIGRFDRLFKVSFACYPECVSTVIMLHPVAGFETAFQMLKPFMSERAKKKAVVKQLDDIEEIVALAGVRGVIELCTINV